MSNDLNGTRGWVQLWRAYSHPRVIGMLLLGFAAGLPFPLVFATLSTWLRFAGIERSTIGFFAWIGIVYSIKVFWSPVVDRLPIPLLTAHLGQRRSWMLLAQSAIAAGLIGMALTDPATHITTMAWLALLVAFASATQDITVDAYRIEAVESSLQGPMAAMYQSGYRIAVALVGGALALYLAEWSNWQVTYITMALCMLVGVITVLIIREPARAVSDQTYHQEQRVLDYLENHAHLPVQLRRINAWFIGAVLCPFIDFFQRNGKNALFILAFIAVYRISDVVLGNMANPFYVDMHFSKSEIASISKIYGVLMTILGATLGGVLVVRWGVLRILLLGAVCINLSILLFTQLAARGHDLTWLAIVISADNFSVGMATSAFIAYLSRLTNTAYTATQYALFSSLMTLFPKILSGFSGVIVDARGYHFFFVYAALLGIPSILMVLYLLYRQARARQP
ncbi:MAG: AmpG family muropeptide MFS transporter [Gammaproteobacteria bacterium]|nr:AmpG family muropeptide MFS transporter [Gammaproteobacteria bacterium]